MFDLTSSEIEPVVAVIMKTPPLFLTLAPKALRTLMAIFDCEVLKVGVIESNIIVTGFLVAFRRCR